MACNCIGPWGNCLCVQRGPWGPYSGYPYHPGGLAPYNQYPFPAKPTQYILTFRDGRWTFETKELPEGPDGQGE